MLRLAIQKLCKDQNLPGKDINDQIGAAVQKGLPATAQQALDSVRVIGNHAVHPGVMDIKDDPSVASALFKLVNLIAEKLITEPQEVAAIFEGLPDGARDAIVRRDSSGKTKGDN